MHAPTPTLDHLFCFALYSAQHAMNRAYKPLLEGLGLTYPQYLVLVTLWERNDLTVKEIGERLFLDSGTLTPLLKRLEKMGHLRRRRDEQDERQVRISLTPEGAALRRRAEALPGGIACRLGDSAACLPSLHRDLIRVREALLSGSG